MSKLADRLRETTAYPLHLDEVIMRPSMDTIELRGKRRVQIDGKWMDHLHVAHVSREEIVKRYQDVALSQIAWSLMTAYSQLFTERAVPLDEANAG